MSTEKDLQKAIAEALLKWEIAKKDRWYFLKYFVRTFDEHDRSVPSKPFPARGYARVIERLYREPKINIVFIKKSRQIRMTWQIAALMLHEALFSYNFRGFDQSKKQDDANGILDRQVFIYECLSRMGLPDLPKAKMTGESIGTKTLLEFPDQHSEIRAIPQGGDIVRSYTCSMIFGDEIHHQPEAQSGYEAAKPTITGGGKWWGVGTANGHSFGWAIRENRDPLTLKVLGNNRVDSRKIDGTLFPKYTGDPKDALAVEAHRRMIEKRLLDMPQEEFDAIPFEILCANTPGVDYWINHNGAHCMFIHYTADPEKDPRTAAGRAWYAEEEAGSTASALARELEGNEELNEGRPTIDNFSKARFVREFDYDSDLPMRTGTDFGTIICGNLLAQLHPVKDSNKFQLRVIDENILRRGDTPSMAQSLQEMIETKYRRSWMNRNLKGYCDPNGDQERETTADKSMNTSIKIMEGFGFYISSKKFGVPDSTKTMQAVFKQELPDGEPMILIHPRCTYLISCIEGSVLDKSGERYEKDGEFDHGMDMLRYLIANCFDAVDLTGKLRSTVYKSTAIRDGHTGRVVGWRRELTPYGRALRRAREQNANAA